MGRGGSQREGLSSGEEEALWELRPLEHRSVREAAAHDGTAQRVSVIGAREDEEVANRRAPLCFGGPLFGGCSLCAAGDDEVVNARPVHRLPGYHWERSKTNFCDVRNAGDCGEKLDEYFEQVEETTSMGDDDSAASGDEAPEEIRRSGGKVVLRRRLHSDDAQDDLLHRELEAVMLSAGDAFSSKGVTLVRVSSGRYRLSGRTIKLFLLPLGAPLPFFAHLLKAFDYEVAERAARIAVCDGSLRQPLLDYVLQTGQNESYDQRGTENIAGVSGAARFLDWNTTGTDDRLYEMRNATMQASMRQNATGEGERVSALQSEGSKLLSRGLYNGASGFHRMPQAPAQPQAI